MASSGYLHHPLRVITLLPSATDVLAAILTEAKLMYPPECHKDLPILVGRSHECDRPEELIKDVPILTAPKTTFTTSGDVHRQVTQMLNSSTSLYLFDVDKFRQLEPDIVLTQDICSVCAIDLKTVEKAVEQLEHKVDYLSTSVNDQNQKLPVGSVCDKERNVVEHVTQSPPPPPTYTSPMSCCYRGGQASCTVKTHVYNADIISLNPTNTKDVLVEQIIQVGKALGLEDAAEEFVKKINTRINRCLKRVEEDRKTLKHIFPPKILFLEWLFPPYVGGHWTPELITMAGGLHPYNPPVKRNDYVFSEDDPFPFQGSLKRISPAIYPKKLVEENADILIICPCGLSLPEALREIEREILDDKANVEETMQWYWPQLRAVQSGTIYVLDGSLMFNRPGPYMIKAFEFLTDLIHLYHTDPSKRLDPKDYDFDFAIWTKSIEEIKAKGRSLKQYSLKEIEEIHIKACEKKESMYVDPNTQCSVLTGYYHENRHTCCGNACRHCPYGHANVKELSRCHNKVKKIVYLFPKDTGNNPIKGPVSESSLVRPWVKPKADTSLWIKANNIPNYSLHAGTDQPLYLKDENYTTVIFWSGGKDAFLSLYEILRIYSEGKGFQYRRIVLLSSINSNSGIAPIQNTSLKLLVQQSQQLKIPIVIVPLLSSDTKEYISKTSEAITGMADNFGFGPVDSVVFGDLSLTDIRNWRQNVFYPELMKMPKGITDDIRFIYPVWLRHQSEELIPLLQDLTQGYDAQVQYSGIYNDEMLAKGIKEGQSYIPAELPENIDNMGENGEFHTKVCFTSKWDLDTKE